MNKEVTLFCETVKSKNGGEYERCLFLIKDIFGKYTIKMIRHDALYGDYITDFKVTIDEIKSITKSLQEFIVEESIKQVLE